ncbi:MAG TPA: helix-turn-helix domain-containing protein [Bacteroidales bacterium]|nr:helix-turn-helix domain-containing protein [Bacteroidales bacterium]
MKQPELGRKISELRKAKGLTQVELAEKCNLSLRTIQRIESSEVMPRSYTIKLIFENLDYEIYSSFGKLSYNLDRIAYRTGNWFKRAYRYIIDLFNLKTNTMKKITILSIPCISIALLLLFTGQETKAQDKEMVRSELNNFNAEFVNWFNAGRMDSIGMVYNENSCLVPANYQEVHGREDIIAYYSFLYQSGFRFRENKSKTMIITDSIVVERGVWTGELEILLTGTYLTQWRFSDGKWLIENEMTNTDYIPGNNSLNSSLKTK